MNLTVIPKELLYEYKTSIDDYDIEDISSLDGIFYNRIVQIPFEVPLKWNKEELILAMFNDAYLLIVIIIKDTRFSLHTHAWINYLEERWNNPPVVSSIILMVCNYIRFTNELPSHVKSASQSFLNDYYKNRPINEDTAALFFKNIPTPEKFLSRGHFKAVKIDGRLLAVVNTKKRICWRTITKDFEIGSIIQVVKTLGNDQQEKLCILKDIHEDMHSKENLVYFDDSLSRQYFLLLWHLESTGELLNKKKLLEEYEIDVKECREGDIERFEEIDDDLTKNGAQGLDYEMIVLKNEISLLKKECEEWKKKYEKMKKLMQARTDEVDKWYKMYDVETKRSDMVFPLEEELHRLKIKCEELERSKEPEMAFNSHTGLPCFTSRQIGILLTAVGRITEKDNPPGKTTIGEIVEKISGYKSKTASVNMKGGIPHSDIEVVASAIEDKYPNLAAEVRKV